MLNYQRVYIYIQSNTCSLHSLEEPADWMSCFVCLVVLGIHDCPSLPFDCQVHLTQILGLSPPGMIQLQHPQLLKSSHTRTIHGVAFVVFFQNEQGSS